MKDNPKLKIVFAPEFFEGFEGTQEELDVLITEITTALENDLEIDELIASVSEDELEDINDIVNPIANRPTIH